MRDRGEMPPQKGTPDIAWSSTFGIAFVPGRVLLRGDAAVEELQRFAQVTDRQELGGRELGSERSWWRLDVETRTGEPSEILDLVALLRAEGFAVSPDHVLFSHGCDECCGPHPSETFDALAGDPYRGNPYRGNPYRGNPYRGNPYRGNPYRGNPYRGNPYRGNANTSSAKPADDRSFPVRQLSGPGTAPRITVLDTGVAQGPQCPDLLRYAAVSGDADAPDQPIAPTTGAAPVAADTWLDPVAGHGTFIAGIVEQLAPGCTISVKHVLNPLGYATESDIVAAINQEAQDPPQLLSLSFGGTVLDEAPALRSAIAKIRLAGTVVVASAGNDGCSDPQYPAAYDGVVAVAALGPDGPTPWTNYGSWVDACAPGLELVSSFFADFDGPEPAVNTEDPDRFRGWASWSGTSFSAPVVVAALAREMVLGNCTAQQAVERIVHAPEALRIRCMGTVVGTS